VKDRPVNADADVTQSPGSPCIRKQVVREDAV
jgi:hypothetical protein